MTSSISAFFSAVHFLSDIIFWRWAVGKKSCFNKLLPYQLSKRWSQIQSCSYKLETHRLCDRWVFNSWFTLSKSQFGNIFKCHHVRSFSIQAKLFSKYFRTSRVLIAQISQQFILQWKHCVGSARPATFIPPQARTDTLSLANQQQPLLTTQVWTVSNPSVCKIPWIIQKKTNKDLCWWCF